MFLKKLIKFGKCFRIIFNESQIKATWKPHENQAWKLKCDSKTFPKLNQHL